MIYICIPTHNEQQTVGVVLWKLRQVLTEYPRDYQILVADDASTDKTQEVLEPYTRVLPLTVIRSEKQQGYAASLEMLLREAARRSEYPKRDVIVTLQADFSEEPDDLVPLIKRMEAGADVAIGTKVSATPQTRLRRWARSLSSFFARGQTWPESVATPFDGFRAYRLHAVKNAIEARPGQRLVRYPGWAGHAELLRAVLPHARRVDTVEVEDRADRLQRPRRERPFAAALEVRAMMRNAEPGGLVGVEELDRIAATASRSRDRSLVTNGASNGGPRTQPDRDRRPGRDRERPEGRSRSSGNDGRGRGRGGEGGAPRAADRTRGSGDMRRGEETRRPPRSEKAGDASPAGSEGRRRNLRKPAAASMPVLLDDEAATAAIQADGSDAPPAPKKKRRRRRGRGGGKGSATAGAEAAGAGDASLADGTVESGAAPDAGGGVAGSEVAGGDAAGEAAADGAPAERKRRRRGGRRGGRGRRRAGAADASADGGSTDEGSTDGRSTDAAAADSSAPAAASAPAAPVTPPAPAAEARSDQE